MNSKQVIDIFVEHGIVQKDQVDDLLQELSTSGKTVMQALVDALLGTPLFQFAPLFQLLLPSIHVDTVPASVVHWANAVMEVRLTITNAARQIANRRTTALARKPIDERAYVFMCCTSML